MIIHPRDLSSFSLPFDMVGRNVAAGMTGGLAYLLDEDDTLIPKVNKEIVKIQRVVALWGRCS